MLRTSCKSDSPPSINEAPHSKCTFLQKKRTLLHLLTAETGTNSPFAALHKSGSYRGLTCRASAVARPVSFDPLRTKL